jgi:putative methionine-R-sulfoxide reductase with GAF domain
MRPEETRVVQEVHVDMRASAMHLACDRCSTSEVVLLEAGEFDDNVKRFMRTHPGACSLPQPT